MPLLCDLKLFELNFFVGMNKMIINHLEKLFVTNDAATVIKELEVSCFYPFDFIFDHYYLVFQNFN